MLNKVVDPFSLQLKIGPNKQEFVLRRPFQLIVMYDGTKLLGIKQVGYSRILYRTHKHYN
jgi:hypothetical protein